MIPKAPRPILLPYLDLWSSNPQIIILFLSTVGSLKSSFCFGQACGPHLEAQLLIPGQQNVPEHLPLFHPSIPKTSAPHWERWRRGEGVKDASDYLAFTEKARWGRRWHGYNWLGLVLQGGNPNYLEGWDREIEDSRPACLRIKKKKQDIIQWESSCLACGKP